MVLPLRRDSIEIGFVADFIIDVFTLLKMLHDPSDHGLLKGEESVVQVQGKDRLRFATANPVHIIDRIEWAECPLADFVAVVGAKKIDLDNNASLRRIVDAITQSRNRAKKAVFHRDRSNLFPPLGYPGTSLRANGQSSWPSGGSSVLPH